MGTNNIVNAPFPLAGSKGGTGINNGTNTITLAGNLATSGAFPVTFTSTASTNVTLPTTGTLVSTGVTSLSSLATVGTITSGTWNGTAIIGTYGGTGVNNGTKTITLGGNLTTSGAFNTTLTATATTSITLPTTGTVLSSVAAPVGTYTETFVAANTGSSYAIDLSTANTFQLTINAATATLSFSNVPASNSASVTIILKQDATGSRLVSWPGSVIWPGGTAPTLSTTASHADIVVMVTTNAGTTWRASLAGANYAS